MREILFRGRRLDNAEWVDGYLYEHEPALVGIVSENDVPEPSKWFIARTGFADWNMPRPVEFVEVDPATVGQYTGLKDKAGKMIFEGDIVSSQGCRGVVCYGEFNCSCCDGIYGWYFDGADIRKYDMYEDIGNIHDNPELLENP